MVHRYIFKVPLWNSMAIGTSYTRHTCQIRHLWSCFHLTNSVSQPSLECSNKPLPGGEGKRTRPLWHIIVIYIAPELPLVVCSKGKISTWKCILWSHRWQSKLLAVQNLHPEHVTDLFKMTIQRILWKNYTCNKYSNFQMPVECRCHNVGLINE